MFICYFLTVTVVNLTLRIAISCQNRRLFLQNRVNTMQTSDDGEYVPSKELDRSFRIPKKRTSQDEVVAPSPAQVLESSYYNLGSEPQPVMTPCRIDAARNLILQNLQKREYERPKTYANHILQETIPDCYDETLPRDLTSLFQPLYCKLCSAQLSSNIVAKLHYKSKNHEKKIRKYLIEYSERTGEPLHKRAKLAPKLKEGEEESNPLYFYCEVCDLPLTGKLHAESHYMGKNHRKATLGVKTPAGKGHYDAEGKWVREGSSHKKLPGDPNDDTFGRDFRPPVEAPTSGFRCELCNITTTCQEQLESHYTGQKHKKKLRQQSGEVTPGGSPHDNILTSVLTDPDKSDCSVYRTPSGHYYCQVCNTSTNSEVQFKQHLQSKNHLKKAAQKKA